MKFNNQNCLGVVLALLQFLCLVCSWTPSQPHQKSSLTQLHGSGNDVDLKGRRDFISCTSGSAAAAILFPSASANAATGSLAAKLSKRDPAALVNSIFNVPPSAQVYPDFLRGQWNISCKYGGYLFPSQKVTRDRLTANFGIPGFQKCSIVALSDVGKESFDYTLSIDETTGLEDRSTSLTTQINANLGYSAVSEILYNQRTNPNRLSVDFVEYRTRNAERIEIFVNGRESEIVPETNTFVCSEYIRQVTFGTGQNVGVPRQAVTNYAHFWTWKRNEDASIVTGNLLTAAYLDPQDPLFFDEPSRPVALYSHVLKGTRA
jgi:hypothetical protein